MFNGGRYSARKCLPAQLNPEVRTKTRTGCKIGHYNGSFSNFLLELRETGQDPRRGHTSTRPGESNGNLATLLRDSTNWLSNIPSLRDTDVIVLLTPVVIPISQDPADTSDPFEPLGRSLAKRHSKIRHIPYTQKLGCLSLLSQYTDSSRSGME
jgi:hypothetical protein